MPNQFTDTHILLLDDHPLILSGVKGLIEQGGARVTTAKTLAEAMEKLAEHSFDLTLLDINLGTDHGLDLLEKGCTPKLGRVMLFSGISEQELICRGYALGATGFVSKNTEPEDLCRALAQLLALPAGQTGTWVWCPEHKALRDSNEHFPKDTLLTPKEREVFLLMREGMADKQIADALQLSIHTIRVHIRAIKRKRGHNRRFEQLA